MILLEIISQLRWFADKAESGGYGPANAIDAEALEEDLMSLLDDLVDE